jgi:hypothetical protein
METRRQAAESFLVAHRMASLVAGQTGFVDHDRQAKRAPNPLRPTIRSFAPSYQASWRNRATGTSFEIGRSFNPPPAEQRMRLSPSLSIPAALVLLQLPAALAAQATTPPASTPAAARPVGCRGTNSSTSSVTLARENAAPWVFPGYSVIESVQPGSPAERAGMRPFDIVVLQDGHDLIANPPAQPALAGDTVVITVRRNGVEIPLTVVLGRWDPPEAAEGVTRTCRPLAATPGGG